ncbi:DUF2867 domain-containing protein [Parasedimentitalea maritima]|uniref:DUF2867 domain-containing protein n=1 Tax=Parasedimentitalea maritima TaxID=2578117 RepID=A0ABY2UYC0_9RHOB|nr:DUF2867 domain-containing protein [Zongyanglinia marina]TLP67870.1 DUF2867 domain-containing protein [Zongyanglinia marina]
MSHTKKTQLPQHSLLHDYVQQGDFMDCYACATDLSVDQAAARAMEFPGWAKGLLRLRNILVAPLGLRSEFPEGEKIGPFPIDQRTENEIILGLDDSHLNFRISILKDGTQAYCATWVHRNNWLGRAYLALIMPFHVLIVRNAVSQIWRPDTK